MKYHVRVPLKSTVVFKIGKHEPSRLQDDISELFAKDEFIRTCESLQLDHMQVIAVCAECGAELNPEEAEDGFCDKCYERLQSEAHAERIQDRWHTPTQFVWLRRSGTRIVVGNTSVNAAIISFTARPLNRIARPVVQRSRESRGAKMRKIVRILFSIVTFPFRFFEALHEWSTSDQPFKFYKF